MLPPHYLLWSLIDVPKYIVFIDGKINWDEKRKTGNPTKMHHVDMTSKVKIDKKKKRNNP